MRINRTLSAVDYVVFIGSLLGALGIGIWSAVKAKKSARTSMAKSDSADAEELVRSKGMSMTPVVLSLMASFLSAIMIIGGPAEIYGYGGEWCITMIGMITAIVGATYVFVPVLYPLQLSSTFEYFEVRYNSSAVRTVAACIFLLYLSLYMGNALYAPVVALWSMTGFPQWAAIFLGGGICTIYSAYGGLRGVVLTDVFQILIMFGSMLTIAIYGAVKAGGLTKVFEECSKYGRTDFFNFTVDPYVRHNFWSLTTNYAVMWLFVFGATQASFQRYSSMDTLKKAKLVVLLNIPGILILVGLAFLTGFILFGFYSTCDPLMTGDIKKVDQILPFFVMNEMGHLYGLPGLFIASLFGGGLSTMSSGLNALASVAWEDGLKTTSWARNLSATQKLNVVRFLGLGFGVVAVGLAFLSSTLGNINQVNVTLTTTFGSPLLAMFLVSLFLPFVNKIGVLGGAAVSFAAACWIGFGAYAEGLPSPRPLPSGIDGCPNVTLSAGSDHFSSWAGLAEAINPATLAYDAWDGRLVASTTSVPPELIERNIYHVSYLLYIYFGSGAGVISSVLISLMTGGLKCTYNNASAFHPLVRRFVKIRSEVGNGWRSSLM